MEKGREGGSEGGSERGEGREWREGGREGGEGGGLINKHYRIVENFTSINYQQTARK